MPSDGINLDLKEDRKLSFEGLGVPEPTSPAAFWVMEPISVPKKAPWKQPNNPADNAST